MNAENCSFLSNLSKFDKLFANIKPSNIMCNIIFQPRFNARKSRDHFIISTGSRGVPFE